MLNIYLAMPTVAQDRERTNKSKQAHSAIQQSIISWISQIYAGIEIRSSMNFEYHWWIIAQYLI